MIFATVGTHEQPFNRLVEYIDKLKGEGKVSDEVIVQTGFSTYEPVHCTWSKFYSYNQMLSYVEDARIVITHGGPASFIMPLKNGKIPVVVPRQYEFNEHVNNHQLYFTRTVSNRMGTIITVVNIEELEQVIMNYDSIIMSMRHGQYSNNLEFNLGMERIVQELLQKK